MSHRTERILITGITLAALFALMLGSGYAVEAAAEGLQVCIRVIIPSLLPFFVLSSLLSAYGFPEFLGRRTNHLMHMLFGLSGEAAAPFFIGLTGGYPLGASAVAELYRSGKISRDDAGRMLAFCNNTGPAFILGTAGAGVFSSVRIGGLLYISHILAAVVIGVLFSRTHTKITSIRSAKVEAVYFSHCFVSSVKGAALSVVNISAFVIFFSAVLGILRSSGIITLIAGELSMTGKISLTQAGSLLSGIFELGSGISALYGASVSARSIAVCSFILGWGGLSVHCQTMAAVSGTDIRLGRHFAGRALHGIISAAISVCLFSFL